MKRLMQLLAATAALVFATLTCQPAIEPTPVDPRVPPVTTGDVIEVPVTEAPVEPVPVTRHVLVVGDSEACAVSSYVKATAQTAGDTADVACKESTTVQNWGTGRLRTALDAHPRTSSVVIFLGTNHYLDSTAPPVGPILDLIAARGLDCVWVGNTAVMGKARKINDLMRAVVTPTCTYFDTEAFGVELRDGIHPTSAAARSWIRAVWSTIPMRYNNDE